MRSILYNTAMPNPMCSICGSYETQLFHKRESYTYLRCADCRVVFLSPVPTTKQIASLYDTHYEFIVDKTAQTRFKNQSAQIFETIKHMSPDARTLLDIGAGYGTFVKLAKRHALDALGLEPAINLFKRAKASRAKILNTRFERYFSAYSSKQFDVISMIHVIEHLSDPERSLRMIIKHVKENGILFIETPNADSHLLNVEGGDYTFLTPPEHVHLFSVQSLETLVRNLGRDVQIKTTTYSYPEHFVGIVRRIKRGAIGKSLQQSSIDDIVMSANQRKKRKATPKPYLDVAVAPKLTPILNIGNKGSILQMYIRVK